MVIEVYVRQVRGGYEANMGLPWEALRKDRVRLSEFLKGLIYLSKNKNMAIIPDNQLLSMLSGKLGNMVIKRYKDKTVITLRPTTKSKKRRKPGELKKLYENSFAAGVKYAQEIIRDPKKKKAYSKKVKPGQSVYNYAISEYSKLYGVKPSAPVWRKGKMVKL